MQKKNLIRYSLIIIVVVFIFVLFFWKEHLSLAFPINAEKFSAFGTMIASLLTAVTVYLLYRQIHEQINDRKASTYPDLYPAQVTLETHDTTISFVNTSEGSYTYPQFYRTNNIIPAKQSSPRVFCSLHNIGLGAAKQIELVWEYDINEVVEFTKDVYIPKWITAVVEIQFYDFLSASNSLEIEMPECYMRCCGEQLNKFGPTKDDMPKPRPSLRLKISFLDIYNNKFEKYFKADFICIFNNISISFKQLTQS